MSKKDLDIASEMAGKTVSSIVSQLGLSSQKREREDLGPDQEPDEDMAGPAVNRKEAANIQSYYDLIPPHERASTFMKVRKKNPGGRGRGGKPRGYVWSIIGDHAFTDDEKCLENIRAEIGITYGPGNYEGTPHDADGKAMKKLPKWTFTITEEQAYEYGWEGEDDDEDEGEGNVNEDEARDEFKEPNETDIEKEKKRAELYEAKMLSEEKKREYQSVLGLDNNKDKGNTVDPMVAELRAKMEADRVRMEQLEKVLATQEAARAEAARQAEIGDLKKMMLELAQKVAQPPAPPPPPAPNPFMQMFESPVFQGVLASALKRLADGPPPPPPPPDPMALLVKLKELTPPPPPPVDIMAIARSVKDLIPAPPPAPDMLGLARTLKELMPAPQQQMNFPEMLTFIKDFNGKSKDLSPIEIMRQMKELAPPQQPLESLLGQMQSMATIMKSMAPDKADTGENELEKFARTLEAIRTIAPDIAGGREEPQKNWLIEGIKALKEPIMAAGQVLQQQTQSAQPDPRVVEAQRQQQMALIRQQQMMQAQAARAAQMGALPQQNVPQTGQSQPQQPVQQQAVPTVTAGAASVSEVSYGDIPVQNGGIRPPVQETTVAAAPPVVTAPVVTAPVVSAPVPPPQAANEGIDPKDLGEFATILAVAIEKDAPAEEVLEFAKEKWPSIVELIDDYDDIEKFEADLTAEISKMAPENRARVEQLVAKLKTEEGRDWATSFVLALKGLG